MAGNDLVAFLKRQTTLFDSGRSNLMERNEDLQGLELVEQFLDVGCARPAVVHGENRDSSVSVEQLVETRIDTSAGTSSKQLEQLGIGNRNR